MIFKKICFWFLECRGTREADYLWEGTGGEKGTGEGSCLEFWKKTNNDVFSASLLDYQSHHFVAQMLCACQKKAILYQVLSSKI